MPRRVRRKRKFGHPRPRLDRLGLPYRCRLPLRCARQGAFVEPQATIAVAGTDMDNFILAGNSVKSGDETDVRGRLGLRVGTSRVVKDGAVIEPWGVVSGGLNVFSASGNRGLRQGRLYFRRRYRRVRRQAWPARQLVARQASKHARRRLDYPGLSAILGGQRSSTRLFAVSIVPGSNT